jgi:hypothetical protein
MPVSGDTLLRLIRAVPVEPAPPARVIGIDDWAWRRSRRYGTLIVDLERANHPIDLLPDRTAETVAAWLEAHPGVEIVARDRAGAKAATAPEPLDPGTVEPVVSPVSAPKPATKRQQRSPNKSAARQSRFDEVLPCT